MTKALAKEFGRYGIRTNVVAPGIINGRDRFWASALSSMLANEFAHENGRSRKRFRLRPWADYSQS